MTAMFPDAVKACGMEASTAPSLENYRHGAWYHLRAYVSSCTRLYRTKERLNLGMSVRGSDTPGRTKHGAEPMESLAF